MKRLIHQSRTILFCGIALTWGLLVPVVFDLGNGERALSRLRNQHMFRTACCVVVATIVGCVAQALFARFRPSEQQLQVPKTMRQPRFTIAFLMQATTFVAVAASLATFVGRHGKFEADAILVSIAAVMAFGYAIFRGNPIRSRFTSYLACQMFPFAWIIFFNKPIGHTTGLLSGIPTGAAFIPSMIILRGLGQRELVESGAGLIALLLIGAGITTAHRGGKLHWGATIAMLAGAGFSSLIFHALYRM